MSKFKVVGHRSFSLTSKRGIERVLPSQVAISAAYDPTTIPQDQWPQMVQFQGIWDTGATGSAITQAVIDACQLKPTGMALVHGVHGQASVETFLVNVALPNGVGVPKVRVTKGQLPASSQVLIGMDIISQGDFAVSNFGGHTCFTFRIPSQATIDFAKDHREQQEALKKRSTTSVGGFPIVGRNDPCPCGSRKKYKKCHGA